MLLRDNSRLQDAWNCQHGTGMCTVQCMPCGDLHTAPTVFKGC